MLEEFQWDSEWVDENSEEVPWAVVDEVIGAPKNLRSRNLHRPATTHAAANVQKIYTRNKKRPRRTSAAPDISGGEEDDSDHDAQEDQHASDPVVPMEEDEDTRGDEEAFV